MADVPGADPSAHPGMGATPFPGGAAFRVWAPFAASVAVAGAFNAWDTSANPLSPEPDGRWSADVPGAKPGDEYKFVLTGPFIPGLSWKNDPYARAMTNSVGNSIITGPTAPWTTPDYVTPAWNELVIYELHVGSFLFDPQAPDGRGTFASVATKLDYLRDLGINAIQLLPSDEFAGDISWGYNPSAIFAIDQLYGGPGGLLALVNEAHARGIAVIYDVVYNHFGPSDLFIWQFDGWNQDNGGGIYFYNDWRRHTGWGDTRPDYGRPEVRQYIRDNALQWLEDFFCDGLRWDATGAIRNVRGANDDPGDDLPDGWSLMQWVNGEIASSQPWKLTIAEDMQDNPWLTLPTAGGGAGFGAQWGAGFLHTLRAALLSPDDSGRDMDAVAAMLAQRYNGRAFQRVVYTESHDEVAQSAGQARMPELIWPGNADSTPSQKRSTLGAALVFTAPGIPMIFMGQEFLTWGAWSDAAQLDWTNLGRFPGIAALYRDLIRLRRDWFATTAGLKGENVHVHHVNDADKLVAFHRWDRGGPGDDVVILANFGARAFDSYAIGLPRPGLWRVRFNGDWGGYSPAFAGHPSLDTETEQTPMDAMPCLGRIGIGAYTALILSQDP